MGDPLQATESHPLAMPTPPRPPVAAEAAAGSSAGFSISDPVESFLGRPFKWAKPAEADVPPSAQGLTSLACKGAWRAVSSLSQKLLATSHPVDELLWLRWHRIVSLLQVGDVTSADRELAVLGDLRGPSWRYERYPSIFPGRRGSMIPFGLLLLQALMPAHQGAHADSQQRLHDLLSEVQAGTWVGTAAIRPGQPTSPGGSRASEKAEQEQQTLLAIVDVLCAARDYPLAIAHLEQVGATEFRVSRSYRVQSKSELLSSE